GNGICESLSRRAVVAGRFTFTQQGQSSPADAAAQVEAHVRTGPKEEVRCPLLDERTLNLRVEKDVGNAGADLPAHVPERSERILVIGVVEIEDVDVEVAAKNGVAGRVETGDHIGATGGQKIVRHQKRAGAFRQPVAQLEAR